MDGKNSRPPRQDPDHVAVTTWAFIVRIWRHCRLRKAAVATVLLACAFETALFWLVPLSFRSLVDNVLGPRDQSRLVAVLAALAAGILIASIASIQRGRLYAHLQSQIVSDMRFEIFHKVQHLPISYFTATPTAEVLSRASSDLAAVEAALAMSVTWGLMPTLDAMTGTLVLFVLDWRLALIASLVWPWCAIVPARLAPSVTGESYGASCRHRAAVPDRDDFDLVCRRHDRCDCRRRDFTADWPVRRLVHDCDGEFDSARVPRIGVRWPRLRSVPRAPCRALGSHRSAQIRMKTQSRVTLLGLVYCSLAMSSLSYAAESYKDATVDEIGIHIVTTDGRSVVLKKDPDQVAFDTLRISPDSGSVGWLALYPNCCTSYPIPLKLMIYSNARVRIFTGSGLPIWKWQFRSGGKQIAFQQETVHGSLSIHYELRDVTSGGLLAKYEPPYDRDNRPLPARDAPGWVRELDTK